MHPEESKKKNKPVKETVLKEFPPVRKYRTRIVKNPQKFLPILDVREYVSTESFEGFTRRGVRLESGNEIDLMIEILKEARTSWPP